MLKGLLVIALCVLTFVLAIGSLGFGIFWPERVENPLARVFLCFTIAVCLGLSSFILYPQNLKLTTIPIIDLAIPVAGPSVLIFVYFWLLLKVVPEPLHWQFFLPQQDGKTPAVTVNTCTLKPVGKDFNAYLVPDREGLLVGILVEFPSGAQTLTGEFKPGFRKSRHVDFKRGEGRVDIGRE